MASINRSQLRLSQITGSFGDAEGKIIDNLPVAATLGAIPSISGSLVDVMSQFASSIKRVVGGEPLTGSFAAVAASTLKDIGNTERISYVDSASTIIRGPNGDNELEISDTGVIIAGDLTVSGLTTTLNTATLTVEDPIVLLGSGNADSQSIGASSAIDLGLILERPAISGASSGFIRTVNDTPPANLSTGDKIRITRPDTTAIDFTVAGSTTGGAASGVNATFQLGANLKATLANAFKEIFAHADFSVTRAAGGSLPGDIASGDFDSTDQQIQVVCVKSGVGHSGDGIASIALLNSSNAAINSKVNVDSADMGTARTFVGGKHGSVAFYYDEGDDVLNLSLAGASASETDIGAKLETDSDLALRMHASGSLQFRSSTTRILSTVLNQLEVQASTKLIQQTPLVELKDVTSALTPAFRFFEGNGGMAADAYIGLRGPLTASVAVDYILPEAPASAGQFLTSTTNAGGVATLSWASEAADSANKKQGSIPANVVSASMQPPIGSKDTLLFSDGLVPGIDSIKLNKSTDVYVNGQMMFSGSIGEVGVGSADYHMNETYKQAEIQIKAAAASYGSNETIAVRCDRNKASGGWDDFNTLTTANVPDGATASAIADLIVTALTVGGGSGATGAGLLSTDNVFKDASGETVIIRTIGHGPNGALFSNPGTIVVTAGGNIFTGGANEPEVTQSREGISPTFGFDLEADDVVTIVFRG